MSLYPMVMHFPSAEGDVDVRITRTGWDFVDGDSSLNFQNNEVAERLRLRKEFEAQVALAKATPQAEDRTEVTVEIFPWRLVWHGGRLADIFHAEARGAVHAISVGDSWDGRTGRHTSPVTEEILRSDLQEFIDADGQTYIENEVPYQ